MAGATKGIVNFVAMVLAFLAMGGFLYWLGVTAVPTETAVALEDDTAQAVSLSAFAQNPIMFEGGPRRCGWSRSAGRPRDAGVPYGSSRWQRVSDSP